MLPWSHTESWLIRTRSLKTLLEGANVWAKLFSLLAISCFISYCHQSCLGSVFITCVITWVSLGVRHKSGLVVYPGQRLHSGGRWLRCSHKTQFLSWWTRRMVESALGKGGDEIWQRLRPNTKQLRPGYCLQPSIGADAADWNRPRLVRVGAVPWETCRPRACLLRSGCSVTVRILYGLEPSREDQALESQCDSRGWLHLEPLSEAASVCHHLHQHWL